MTKQKSLEIKKLFTRTNSPRFLAKLLTTLLDLQGHKWSLLYYCPFTWTWQIE